jgi:TRAP-type C4-dicarboxylate transport system permease large subunit
VSRFEKHALAVGFVLFLAGGLRPLGDNYTMVVAPFVPALFFGGIVLGLLAGIMFLIIGILILFYARNNKLSAHSSFQVSVNAFISRINVSLGYLFNNTAQFILGLLFIVTVVILFRKGYREIKESRKEKK